MSVQVFLLLNLADALITMWALKHGYHELNPVMKAVMAHGLWAFFVAKMGLASWIAWKVPRRSMVLPFGNLLVFCVVCWNFYVLFFRATG